jgi:hypothetical protein
MTAFASRAPSRVRVGSFYTWMAAICVLAAFLGFAPTYWAPLAAGRFQANPVVHFHGLFFFGWTLFLLVQSALPWAGQLRLHRELGYVGVSLATAMTMLGILVALNSLKTAVALNVAPAGEAFLIVPLVGIATFAVLVALSIGSVRRPEVHKRLMLVATSAILGAPVARPIMVALDLPPGPPPVWINYVNLLCFMLIVAGMAYDWRTRGRPHPVYLITLPILVFLTWVVIPISETAAWHGIARDFLALAGTAPVPPPPAG